MTSVSERFAWLDLAACRDRPDWDSMSTHWTQLAVCSGCPVRPECLSSALELRTGGVRGGTRPATRDDYLRARDGWAGKFDPRPWITMRDGRPDPADDPALTRDEYERVMGYGTETYHYLRTN